MKACILYNRASGRKPDKKSYQRMKEDLFHSLPVIYESRYKGHNLILTRKAVNDGNQIVFTAGGDGTINEVINGLVGSNCVLAVIPKGTANDLASNMGLNSQELNYLNFPNGYCKKKIDLIRVNNRYFATVGGFGLASDAAKWSNRVRNKTGWIGNILRRAGNLTYLLSVIAVYPEYRNNPVCVNIKSEQHTETSELFSLILANQPFFGKWFRIAPKALNNDGLIDICLMRNTKNQFQSIEAVCKVMTGKHYCKPYVQYWQDTRLTITSEQPIAFFGDGEIFEINTHFDVQLVPEALNILVPQSGSNITQRSECNSHHGKKQPAITKKEFKVF